MRERLQTILSNIGFLFQNLYQNFQQNKKRALSILTVVLLLIGTIVAVVLANQKQLLSFKPLASMLARKDVLQQSDYVTSKSLPSQKPIYNLSVSGQVVLQGKYSFVRIILVDKKQQEYLVYESYPLIADSNNFRVTNSCEETCYLNQVTPSYLRIEGNTSTFTFTNISTTQDLPKLGLRAPQEIAPKAVAVKQQVDQVKVSKLNTKIKQTNLKWQAGQTSISKLTYAEKRKLFVSPEGKKLDHLPNLQGFEYYKGGVFEVPTATSNDLAVSKQQLKSSTPNKGGGIGLSINVSSVSATIQKGTTVRVFDLTSIGATQYTLWGNPTGYGPGINWTPSSGGTSYGLTIPINIQVDSNVPDGAYSGQGIIKSDTSTNTISFPVNITIVSYTVPTPSVPTPTMFLTPTLTPIPSPTPTPIFTLPKNFDYRNFQGENWLTSIKNQGSCGSCWDFAATAATEAQANLYYNQHLDLDLAEQDPLSCGNAGSCGGGWPNLALNYFGATGIVDEACFPYSGKDLACQKCSDWSNRVVKIGGYENYDGTEKWLKEKLMTRGVLTGIIWSWRHAMALVGWNTDTDGQPIWIYKNSWGADWGEAGYAKLKLSLTDMGAYALLPSVTVVNKSVQIACVDKDNDGYCNWGLSKDKPASCPSSCRPEKDCNDSDSRLSTDCLITLPTPTPTPIPSPACNACRADVNIDGWISGPDVSSLVPCWNKKTSDVGNDKQPCSGKDVNEDGNIDQKDVDCMKEQWLKQCLVVTPYPSPGPSPTGTPLSLSVKKVTLTPPTGSIAPSGRGDFIVELFSIIPNPFDPTIPVAYFRIRGKLINLPPNKNYIFWLCVKNGTGCSSPFGLKLTTDNSGFAIFKDVLLNLSNYANNPISYIKVGYDSWQNIGDCSLSKPCLQGDYSISEFIPSPFPTLTPTLTPSFTPTPIPQPKRIFLTSTTYNGNLGGLSGADAKCQAQANAANLGGTWKAWLSDANTSAASRLAHNNGSYKLLNGTIVANNWADLTDGTLQRSINITENSTNITDINYVAWTHTQASGGTSMVSLNMNACTNFTSGNGAYMAAGGLVNSSDAGWTAYNMYNCNEQHSLYCFEQ